MSELKDLGIALDFSKAYSPSFINTFLDCGRRALLTSILRLRDPETSEGRLFGSALHEVYHNINTSLKEESFYCDSCQFNDECHVFTGDYQKALVNHKTDCPILKMANKVYSDYFDPIVCSRILEKYASKDKRKDGEKVLKRTAEAFPLLLFQGLTLTPRPEVLMAEARLEGQIGSFKVMGYLDALLKINDRVCLVDYKTRSTKPKEDTFPLRQTAFYLTMLAGQNILVDDIVIINLKWKGKIEVIPQILVVEENKECLDAELGKLLEDMSSVRKCMASDIFSRNRSSMFCPCSAAKYCNNPALVIQDYKKKKKESPKE